MITSINKLENLGLYDKISSKRCQDFKRYNLIYGWSGSGKITLSRLFAFVREQKILDDFCNVKTTITCNGVTYNQQQFLIESEKILVFNEDFVNDNINWNGTIKSIFLSLTFLKRKNRYNPCIYWSIAIFAIVIDYSNLFVPFAIFLNCSYFALRYKLIIRSESTDFMQVISNGFSFV